MTPQEVSDVVDIEENLKNEVTNDFMMAVFVQTVIRIWNSMIRPNQIILDRWSSSQHVDVQQSSEFFDILARVYPVKVPGLGYEFGLIPERLSREFRLLHPPEVLPQSADVSLVPGDHSLVDLRIQVGMRWSKMEGYRFLENGRELFRRSGWTTDYFLKGSMTTCTWQDVVGGA